MRYAFPCARVLVDVRKTITEDEWLKMKEAVENDVPLDRSYLERLFTNAVKGFKKISDDYWRIEVIREYFWHQHEENLSKDLPPMIKRLCVVKKGQLEKQIGDYFKVDLGDGDVRIVGVLYRGAKVGDTVMVHHGYAVEKI
ncbi:hypothetical protein KY335_02375 [Candidatus Woesearchaeota archaeon]|nr:hypothetical protein [Candidatus Woesearchaeota archaeon]MBW3014064.1 hypothetical protein [Candidatus Woesearchaeota archaeon]